MSHSWMRSAVKITCLAGLALVIALPGCAGKSSKDADERVDITVNLSSPPDLEPAVSAKHIQDFVAAFAWNRTQALAELNDDGTPALFYARVYVKNRDEVSYLDQAFIHHSNLPLLPSERQKWAGKIGRVRPPSDGRGQMIHAVIPGKIYNIIRNGALAGDKLFDAIELVDLPAEAKLPNGAFSWDFLVASGFRYRGIEPERPGAAPSTKTGNAQQGVLLLAAREVLKLAAEAAEELTRLIARAAGNRDRNGLLFGAGAAGTADVFITTNLRNTDSHFGGTLPTTASGLPDQSTPMRRSWGDKLGQQVKLPGARVSIWSHGDSTVLWLPTLFEGTTNDDGKAHLQIAKNRKMEALCIATENDAAEVTDLLTEIEVCDFTAFAQGKLDNLTTLTFITVNIQDGLFNVLAQATEAREYLRQVVGYTPHKVDILVGPIANLIGEMNGGAAFASCMGFPNVTADVLVVDLITAVSAINPIAGATLATITPLMAVDIVLPDGANLTSRGIVTHEYGHFATCSILYDDNPLKISTTWMDAVVDRLIAGSNPGPSHSKAYTIESIADFFAGQVVGGTNYFAPGYSRAQFISYCNATSNDCLEHNFSSTSDFESQVARVTTTVHDAFDGQLIWTTGGNVNTPTNGDIWIKNGSLFEISPTRSGNAYDEVVALPGSQLRKLIGRLDDFSQGAFMTALGQTIRENGYNWCETCDVFAQHDQSLPATNTPLERYAVCGQQPIASWIGPTPDNQLPQNCNFAGCPPGSISDYFNNQCVPCPDGYVSVGGQTCERCPDGSVIIDNQCFDCPPNSTDNCTTACAGRTHLENGVCVDCPWAEVAVNGVCQPCPDGLYRNENECVAQCPVCGDANIVDEFGVCVCIIL